MSALRTGLVITSPRRVVCPGAGCWKHVVALVILIFRGHVLVDGLEHTACMTVAPALLRRWHDTVRQRHRHRCSASGVPA